MNKIRHSLLTKLLFMQVTVVLLGGIAIFSTFFLSSLMVAKSDLESKKKEISSKLSTRLDEWTAWHQVGMSELLSEELADFKTQNGLKTIQFDNTKAKRNFDGRVVLASSLAGLFLTAELEKQSLIQVFFNQKNVLVSIFGLTFIFLLISFISFVYLRKKIHQPIIQLINSMNGNIEESKDIRSNVEATDEMRVFVDEISSLFEKIKMMERTSALGLITAQVSHDLISPISSLEVLLENSSASLEEKELLSLSVSRIKAIADDLLEKNRGLSSLCFSITKDLEEVIFLKQAEFSSLGIDLKCYIDLEVAKAELKVSSLKLKRTLSNLINNSCEAYEGKKGLIEVSAFQKDGFVQISVKDHGRGISEKYLGSIGGLGKTFNKVKGSGLGLYSAKQLMLSVEGNLEIKSEPGEGTEIILQFPFQIL